MFPAAEVGAGAGIGDDAQAPEQEREQRTLETTGGMIVDYFQRTFWSGGGSAEGVGVREGGRI